MNIKECTKCGTANKAAVIELNGFKVIGRKCPECGECIVNMDANNLEIDFERLDRNEY